MLVKDYLINVYNDFENAYANTPKIEIGFRNIDSFVHLYKGKGALITIGARPAMGKTTFMFSIMENMMKNKYKVLLFSLEMSAEQAVKKILIQKSEVGIIKQYNCSFTQTDWEKLASSMTEIEKWDLHVEDESNMNVEQIGEKIKEIKPEVVFIDYLQLIAGKRKTDRVTQIDEIMKELKHIAKENGILIFIASQLSRAIECRYDKRPMLSDLRESGSIENISDVVMFIYRDEYYNPKDEDEIRIKGDTEIIVAKNRFGPVGTEHLQFKANIPKFYERTEDYFDVF